MQPGSAKILSSPHTMTGLLIRASLDRYQVEHAFRQTKAGEFGNLRPTWHWTDSKLRCDLLSCVVALTYLSLIRLWLQRAGVKYTADHAMQSMRNLASCLCWQGDKRKPVRMIEEPDSSQAKILQVKFKMGYYKASTNSMLLSMNFLKEFAVKSERLA